ncbi:hypothetical protein, partial [Glutamicibacter ardleyensis]
KDKVHFLHFVEKWRTSLDGASSLINQGLTINDSWTVDPSRTHFMASRKGRLTKSFMISVAIYAGIMQISQA